MEPDDLKILAIDDNQDDLALLKAAASANLPGATLLPAADGPRGIELALAEDPDVILLDIVLPGIDGFEVCQMLKGDERLSHIPVLFITAFRTDTESRVKALEAGAEGFLAKPIEDAELIAQVRAMAKIKAAHRLQKLHEEELSSLVAERTRDLEKELGDRKRAEQELATSWRLLQDITDNSSSLIYALDLEGRFLLANRSLESLFGVPRGTLISRTRAAILPPELAAAHRENDQLVIEKCQAITFEEENDEADGKHTYLSVKFPLLDSVGDVYGVGGISTDVTGRRKVEEALRKNEAILVKAQEIGKMGSWEWDLATNQLRWSEEVYRLYGLDPEKDRPDYSVVVDTLAPDCRDDFLRAINDALSGSKPFDGEYSIMRPDGVRRYTHTRGEVLRDSEGNPTGMLGVVQDITERRQAEEERLALERQLMHSQKLESLGVLAGGIAHDFNNLLQIVLGNVEMAGQGLPPGASARLDLEEAIRATNRAADLSRQMLAYAGKGQFVIEEVNMNDLVAENASMFRTAISRTVDLRIHREPELPPVLADVAQMQQVLMNLLTNASEAIGEAAGNVTLRTGLMVCDAGYLSRSCLEEKPAPGQFIWLEVTDDGCGMDEETRKRLFEPFYTTKFAGRGLGLSAVMGIVRGHHGALMLESDPGRGTTIRVLFPAVQREGVAAAEAKAADPGVAGAVVSGMGTVLVVDDEPAVRAFCAKVVRSQGYDVLTARDGEEAVRLFREHRETIRCTLLDFTMPRMSGLSTFQEIRRIKPDAKVILCSGYGEEKATESFRGRGLAGFLQKPYTLDAVTATLKGVLECSATRQAGSSIAPPGADPVER